MWSPTHVQVLVKRAKGLILKGKQGTNDAFVTISLGKEKFQTSVKEKINDNPEWCEQCELTIPQHGNTAEIVLTVLHRNFLGVDEFLGMVSIPLRDFDVHERPRSRWHPLKCKPGQTKTDYRGELEVRISFTVKANSPNKSNQLGSTADLKNKEKHKGSLQSLNKAAANFGGSLISLGSKEKKHLKKLAGKVSHKVEKVNEKAKRTFSKTNINNNKSDTLSNRFTFADDFGTGIGGRRSFTLSNRDPGVNSDDENDPSVDDIINEDDMLKFDQLSYKSSGSSLNVTRQPTGIISRNSTPLSGSLERVDESLKSSGHGTPNSSNERRFHIKSATMGRLSQRELYNKKIEEETPALDEWEAKLLGKKEPIPFNSKKTEEEEDDYNDTISLSQISESSRTSNSFSKANRPGILEQMNNSPVTKREVPASLDVIRTPDGRKKIIPVSSESSPSPESPRYSKSSGSDDSKKENDSFEAEEKKKKTSGFKKIKSSYSSLVKARTHGSHFSLNQLLLKGFRDKEKVSSNESIGEPTTRHSRTQSDSSGVLPPSGTRVVLGRETTPTPNNSQRLTRVSKEIWDRFEGRSREELVEMIVSLQNSIELQARKQSDLEDYIDKLLMKVIAKAPGLLQKDANGMMSMNSEMLANSGLK